MIHIEKDFISNYQRNLIIKNLSRNYQTINELEATETALGYDANSRMAEQWSIENPIRPYTEDAEYNMSLRLIYYIYKLTQEQLETTFNKKFRLVNCILNKMSPGAQNPMHTDDQPGYDDPVHTCLIYLSGSNIDFTGGELYFMNENKTIEPARNMLIMFQGNESRPHEVKQVLSGTRETITMQFTTHL
jgi:Rps23 Pro-64 3,4-dihydroxylase Tpa1-like proline 4-hydroxylase